MNNDRIIHILIRNNEDSNPPLYNKSSTIIIRAPTLNEDTKLQITRLQPLLFQALTWTSRGSKPIFPSLQHCLYEAPTLSLI